MISSHESQPDFDRRISPERTVSLREFLLWGLLLTAAALPVRYAADSRFRSLVNTLAPIGSAPSAAETAPSGVSHLLYQAIGEGWGVGRCGGPAWSERVKMVMLSSVPEIRFGFDGNGNKIAVSVTGQNGETKVCPIERLKK